MLYILYNKNDNEQKMVKKETQNKNKKREREREKKTKIESCFIECAKLEFEFDFVSLKKNILSWGC